MIRSPWDPASEPNSTLSSRSVLYANTSIPVCSLESLGVLIPQKVLLEDAAAPGPWGPLTPLPGSAADQTRTDLYTISADSHLTAAIGPRLRVFLVQKCIELPSFLDWQGLWLPPWSLWTLPGTVVVPRTLWVFLPYSVSFCPKKSPTQTPAFAEVCESCSSWKAWGKLGGLCLTGVKNVGEGSGKKPSWEGAYHADISTWAGILSTHVTVRSNGSRV